MPNVLAAGVCSTYTRSCPGNQLATDRPNDKHAGGNKYLRMEMPTDVSVGNKHSQCRVDIAKQQIHISVSLFYPHMHVSGVRGRLLPITLRPMTVTSRDERLARDSRERLSRQVHQADPKKTNLKSPTGSLFLGGLRFLFCVTVGNE